MLSPRVARVKYESLPAAAKVTDGLIANVRSHILEKELKKRRNPYIAKTIQDQSVYLAVQSKCTQPDGDVERKFSSSTKL